MRSGNSKFIIIILSAVLGQMVQAADLQLASSLSPQERARLEMDRQIVRTPEGMKAKAEYYAMRAAELANFLAATEVHSTSHPHVRVFQRSQKFVFAGTEVSGKELLDGILKIPTSVPQVNFCYTCFDERAVQGEIQSMTKLSAIWGEDYIRTLNILAEQGNALVKARAKAQLQEETKNLNAQKAQIQARMDELLAQDKAAQSSVNYKVLSAVRIALAILGSLGFGFFLGAAIGLLSLTSVTAAALLIGSLAVLFGGLSLDSHLDSIGYAGAKSAEFVKLQNQLADIEDHMARWQMIDRSTQAPEILRK